MQVGSAEEAEADGSKKGPDQKPSPSNVSYDNDDS